MAKLKINYSADIAFSTEEVKLFSNFVMKLIE